MKFSIKNYMLDNFIAPACAVVMLGLFGAVCIGFIHRFSYSFILFMPITAAVVLLLFFMFLFRALWQVKKNRKQAERPGR